MHTQISFGGPMGNPCGGASTGNGFTNVRPNSVDVFPLCISVSPLIYSLRIKRKCRYRYRYWVFSPKRHSTKKHTACLDKNSPPADDGPKIDPNTTPNLKLNWGPYEDLFGVGTDMEPRNIKFSRPEPRSWFGPNGQYVKELPCPSCRGRGYMLCSECGMDRSRPACTQCHGKGLTTCLQCLGECVVWEETIDELPWEKARTSSPLNVIEDEEIDNLEIELAPVRKSKRIYASLPPEVSAKISRTLKNLNAVTGIFSKRMKKVHSDPILHAQRVEAMKRAKRTAAARQHISETLKVFFSNPENRLKRSLSMRGVKIHCTNCGQEGHRRHYCPSLKDVIGKSWYTCRICGKTGHNRQTCRQNKENIKRKTYSKRNSCGICGEAGHNSRTCPQNNLTKSYSGQRKEKGPRIPTSTSFESNRAKRTVAASQEISEIQKSFFSDPQSLFKHSLPLKCDSKHQKG